MQLSFEFGVGTDKGLLFSAGYYANFQCLNTGNSNVATAWDAFVTVDATRYFIPTHDCESNAIKILSAYSAYASHIFSLVPRKDVTPNEWFSGLTSVGFGPVISVGAATNPI
jgi:hypothetical protein